MNTGIVVLSKEATREGLLKLREALRTEPNLSEADMWRFRLLTSALVHLNITEPTQTQPSEEPNRLHPEHRELLREAPTLPSGSPKQINADLIKLITLRLLADYERGVSPEEQLKNAMYWIAYSMRVSANAQRDELREAINRIEAKRSQELIREIEDVTIPIRNI